MVLAAHCLGPGSCKPQGIVQASSRIFLVTRGRRRRFSSSSGSSSNGCQILHNEKGTGDESGHNNKGSESVNIYRHQSLREQLGLLSKNLVLRSTPGSRKSANGESERPSSYLYSKNNLKEQRSAGSVRPLVSSSVGQLLGLLKGVKESEEEVLSALNGWKISLSSRDLVAALNALNSWRVALFLFKWLQGQENASLNIYTYNVILKVLRHGRQWKIAEGIAEDMIHAGVLPDNVTYSTIISCANQCDYQDDAIKWFQRMHEAHCTPDEVTFTSMIDVYGKCGCYDEAIALYKELRKAGWKPDRVTFGTMIKVFGRARNPRQAILVFREMKEAGIEPDAVVYNTLISLLGRLGRNSYALRIFDEMEQTGVKPTAITLSTLMETYSRMGDAEEALKIFARFKKGIACDSIVYNTVIKVCGDAGFMAEAEGFLREMIEVGCPPTDRTYKHMMSSYAKRGMIMEAQKLFLSSTEAGYEADVVAYTCLLQAYGVAKEYKKFVEIFDRMVEADCNLDEKLCGLVLNLLTLCDTTEGQELLRKCLLVVNSRLNNIVGHLLEENIDVNHLQMDLQLLLTEVPEVAHKPFCNSLLDFSWNKGNRKQSYQLLSVLSMLGIYLGLQSKSSILWSLHLRGLSASTAHCVLLSWLSSINVSVQEGYDLPSRIVIETGAGRQRGSDEPTLNAVVSSVLRGLKSPFKENMDRNDWLVATGTAVSSWLERERLDLPLSVQVKL